MPSVTKWYNPLDVEVFADVYTNEQRFDRITFAPKAETMVPSDFDRAIKCDQFGTITGGCPMLINVSAGEPIPAPEPAVVAEPAKPSKGK